MIRPGEVKPQFSKLPLRAVLETTKPMVKGIAKHGEQDYLNHTAQQFVDAWVRHMVLRERGEMRDAETGELHSAHMAANSLIVCELDLQVIDSQPHKFIRAFERSAAFNAQHKVA